MPDAVQTLYDRIYAVADEFRSHKDAVKGFDQAGVPPEFKFVYAIDYVDSDIRNGGIYQLHGNSTWHLILDAIEGARHFGFDKLSANLKAVLYYYHRAGRSKMKKRIPADFFDQFPEDWEKDLETLEDEYYACFDKLGTDDTRELWRQAISNNKIPLN